MKIYILNGKVQKILKIVKCTFKIVYCRFYGTLTIFRNCRKYLRSCLLYTLWYWNGYARKKYCKIVMKIAGV